MMIVNIVVYNFMVYYWLHMVDVHIMMIKIVKAMVRMDIMMEMSMTCISEMVKLIGIVLPLGLMSEPFHIFMMGVMMIIMIHKVLAIGIIFHIVL